MFGVLQNPDIKLSEKTKKTIALDIARGNYMFFFFICCFFGNTFHVSNHPNFSIWENLVQDLFIFLEKLGRDLRGATEIFPDQKTGVNFLQSFCAKLL